MGYSEYPPSDVVRDYNQCFSQSTDVEDWSELPDDHVSFASEDFETGRAWYVNLPGVGIGIIRADDSDKRYDYEFKQFGRFEVQP